MIVRVLWHLVLLEMSQWLPRPMIEKMQWRRCKRMIRHAYTTVPFYKKKFTQAGITPDMIRTRDDLKRIPITTREEMQKENILAEGYDVADCFTSHTSGSTGRPLQSFFDKRAWDILKFAAKARARQACGLRVFDKVINIEAATPEAVQGMRGGFFNRMRYCSINEPIPDHIAFFERIKPRALYGFPSYFVQLAQHGVSSKPALIFTSAELLDAASRKIIEENFGKRYFDIYGSTEFKEIAWECRRKEGYHINEELFLVEFMPVKDSTDQEIIVTSLVNKAMPLIRYALGDRGCELGNSCSCGRSLALMHPTCGRSVDYFLLPGKTVSPYALTTTTEHVPNIEQYQFIQESKSKVLVKICGDHFNKKDEKQLRKNLQDILGKKMRITIERVRRIPREKSGKYCVVKSLVKR